LRTLPQRLTIIPTIPIIIIIIIIIIIPFIIATTFIIIIPLVEVLQMNGSQEMYERRR
jgi:uncharacterized membrane protein YqiK